MDTMRATKVILTLFAIMKRRRAQNASRRDTPALGFALPPRPGHPAHARDVRRSRAVPSGDRSSVSPEQSPRVSDEWLSPEALLHDVYWILRNCRGGSLTEMMHRYRAHLLRKGWIEATADTRVLQVRVFVAKARGEEAAAGAPLRQKLARLRQAISRRK